MSKPFRLAHLSDLHFFHMKFDVKQFFNKRWIGNLNYLIRRKKEFDYGLLDEIPSLLVAQGVDLVLVSGDLTCTSSKEEFEKAAAFLERLKKEGLEVVVIPGNHDHYTANAHRQRRFYDFFRSSYDSGQWNLKDHRIAIKHLEGNWWLFLLDTTLATPLLCCHGKISHEAEVNFKKALASLPPNSQVILANHFPIGCKKKRPALQKRKVLLDILKANPQVRFYLHGHNHKHTIVDLREKGLPVTVDTGSATLQATGSWTLMECCETSCSFKPFRWNIEKKIWQVDHSTSFTW